MGEGERKKVDMSAVCGYVVRKGGLRAVYLDGETIGSGRAFLGEGEALFRIEGVEGFTGENFLILLGMEAEEKGCRVRDLTALVNGDDDEGESGGYIYISADGAVREELEAALSLVGRSRQGG